MSYEKLYQISFAISTLFAFTMFSSNLETTQRVYSAKNEVKASTGVLESEKTGSKILQKTIWKQSISQISELSSKKSIVVSAEKKSKTWDIPNANTVLKKDTKSYESKIILRNWWNDPRVQYAYNISGGDMDFIKTIEAESKWDINALWDKGKSFWLCQIHKGYNSAMQKAYRALKTDNEKVKMCYDQYKDWVKRWVIKTRLYWFNVRNKPQNKNSFTIK